MKVRHSKEIIVYNQQKSAYNEQRGDFLRKEILFLILRFSKCILDFYMNLASLHR